MKIFHNAIVYTGDSFTNAFAVDGGQFTAIGPEALALPGERIDLGGAYVCAGFNDSHMHLLNFGQALHMAPLADHTASLEQMLACLKDTRPDRGWIIGRGWNQDRFCDVHRMPGHRDLSGCCPYLPREAFSVKEAIDSFTRAGAFAGFEEHIKGRIAPGYLADFVVLGADPFTADPSRIKDIPILQTWLEGDRVW